MECLTQKKKDYFNKSEFNTVCLRKLIAFPREIKIYLKEDWNFRNDLNSPLVYSKCPWAISFL